MVGDFLEVVELHREVALPLRLAAELGGVGEHLGLRRFDLDGRRAVAVGRHALDASAPSVQVADDVAGEVVRDGYLHLHYRFQQDGVRLLKPLRGGVSAGDFERDAGRVHRVEAAVHEGGAHVHDGVAGDYAVRERAADALFDGGDVLARHDAAHDGVGELESGAARQGFDLDPHVAELPVSARLLLVAVLHPRAAAYRFLVRHLRRFERHLHAELAPHLLQRHVEMRVAQAAHQRLVRVRLPRYRERRVFLHDARERAGHLVHVGFGFGIDRHAIDGRGEVYVAQDELVVARAEGVAGEGGAELGDRADVAGGEIRDGVLLSAADLEHLRHALRRAAPGVLHLRIRRERSAIDAEVGYFADERVGGGLEHQRGDGSGAVAGELAPLVGAGRAALRRRRFGGGRQVFGHEVHQLAHARLV